MIRANTCPHCSGPYTLKSPCACAGMSAQHALVNAAIDGDPGEENEPIVRSTVAEPVALKPMVKDHELYFTDNGRILCGRHCGTSARYTFRDISGQRIQRVTARAATEWLAEVGEPIACEMCACGVKS